MDNIFQKRKKNRLLQNSEVIHNNQPIEKKMLVTQEDTPIS